MNREELDNTLKMNRAAYRKATPVFSGVLKYFPDALQAVARCSQAGNDQHHPDTPLHWDRAKSTDELDALTRHLLDAGTMDTDGIRHSAKVAWRALANLQKEIEKETEQPNTTLGHSNDEFYTGTSTSDENSWKKVYKSQCDL
tara:strand:+ start:48 stop:476 length:429 start_codon:yes stop_codon:yes gene_type:complete